MPPHVVSCPLGHTCDQCLWWVRFPGINNATKAFEDLEGCAVNMMNYLLIDTIRQTHQVAAAVESFRNEMATQQSRFLGLMQEAVDQPQRLEN